LVEKSKNLKLGAGDKSDTDVSPVCYRGLYDRIHRILDTVEPEGGKIWLDGRQYKDPVNPEGNYIGPTIIEVTD